MLITYHYPDLVGAVEWLKIWTADFQRDTKTKNSLRNGRFILWAKQGERGISRSSRSSREMPRSLR